ncbi:ABC transporter substrate-binding protein [Nonomuraea sp. NPDC055795]
MADLRNVIAGIIRRPAFWRADPPLPVVLVSGEDAFEAATWLARPYEHCVWNATIKELPRPCVSNAADEEDEVQETPVLGLVAALAGEDGQLGKPVGGTFLPPPRFPLVQFVLWARAQRTKPPEGLPRSAWLAPEKSHTGYRELKRRLREWRSAKYFRGLRTSADFVARAATTWVPLGTLAVWWVGGASDLVGVLPWLLGLLVALLGTAVQAVLSIQGTLFTGWFRRMPYLRRGRFERLPDYALRLANASDDDIERLLVHALCRDLREAYKKWLIPWPSWGRGLYCLVLLEVKDPDGTNARFLRLVEETTEESGLLAPMVVLAAVPEPAPPPAPPVPEELDLAVDGWRKAVRLNVPRLRVNALTPAPAAATPYTAKRWPSQARAVGYWLAVGLLLVLPAVWVVWTQQERDARCGGLAWVERRGAECVGIVNAEAATPETMFGGEMASLIKKIDANNGYAVSSGRYVSIVLFGEFSIRMSAVDDTRLAGSLAELAAVEEYQRTVSSTPRLRVLIANAGDNYGHARRTAELITGLAAQDPRVMGVVGFSRSVEGVRQAVGVLHDAKIPMVASTATADRLGYLDDTGASSPYYFHVAPTNFRVATLASRYIRDELLKEVSKPTAVIVQDGTPQDEYTNNLAADFRDLLPRHGVTIAESLPYTVEQGGITAAVVRACQLDPGVIVYAGRAPEFRDFLNVIEGKACGEGVVKVIASDDVVKVVADHGADIADMKQVEVYHLSLANRAMWAADEVNPTAFVSRLLQGAHPNAPDDNLILTYDATSVIYQAANTAYKTALQAGLPSRGDILYRLSRTSGGAAWEGSSGVIGFGPSERHGPIDKALAIMRVARGKHGHSQPVVRCGPLDAGEAATKDALCRGLPDDAPAGVKAP